MHSQSPRPAPSAASFLRSAQVAAILQVSPKTISRWAQQGLLPYQRTLGGHRRYPHPVPSPTPASAGSVLDGEPRILIPLPEVAQRLGISRWQAYKLARSGRLPTTRLGARDLHVPAAVLRRIEQEGLPPAPKSDGGEMG